MSRVFSAIDAAAPQGLEAMLQAIAETAKDEHDYETYSRAMGELKELKRPVKGRQKKQKRRIDPEKRAFHREAAEGYLRDGNITGAADQFRNAGDYKRAVDLYFQDGSEESIKSVIYLMACEGLDFVKGVLLAFEKEGISHSLYHLTDYEFTHADQETRQRAADKVIKAFYQKLVDQVKEEIAKTGEPAPDTNSLTELLEGRHVFLYDFNYMRSPEMHTFTNHSADPHVLRIAMEFLEYERRHDRSSLRDDTGYDFEKMGLKARMPGTDAFFAGNYFWNYMQSADSDDPLHKVAAWELTDLLTRWKQYPAALEINARVDDIGTNYRHFEILRAMGDRQRLAAAYRDAGHPFDYAKALAGLEV